jgi:acetyl esterase/lipase
VRPVSLHRRDFLKAATLAVVAPSAVSFAATASSYNPGARLDLTVTEVEMRRTTGGRMLMARIYRPAGPGPFPVVMDLHGGAWNAKDRTAEEPFDAPSPAAVRWSSPST